MTGLSQPPDTPARAEAPSPTLVALAEAHGIATEYWSFFGEHVSVPAATLHAILTAMGVDTLLMTGCTTSGCIRASAVDAVQDGFRPIVIRECVGDRHDGPHEANLFDINAKYGDVISKAAAMKYLRGLKAGR